MEQSENMDQGTDIVSAKTRGVNKVVIAVVIVALVAGVFVYFKGNPFAAGEAVVPAGMPEALREVTSNAAVAKVNGEKIDRTTYNNMLASVGQLALQQGVDLTNTDAAKEIKQVALTNVINSTLLQQAAAAAGSVGTDEAVEAQIQTVVTQLGGEEKYKEALVSIGLTDAKYRETIKGQIALNEYIEATLKISEITVSDDEISERYNQFVATAGENAKDLPKLADATEEIRGILIQEKQEVLVSGHIETLRAEADIKEILTF